LLKKRTNNRYKWGALEKKKGSRQRDYSVKLKNSDTLIKKEKTGKNSKFTTHRSRVSEM